MNKTAILLGATGLTGGLLLQLLLKDDAYAKVKLFSRKSVGISHPKIEEYLLDLFALSDYKNEFVGDVVFCCIGSTQAKTPDTTIYKKVDYGIPVAAAQLSKTNHIPTFIVVSALGANPESRFFYNRTKGEMERDVLAENIENTFIFQPSLIDGARDEKRPFELLWKKTMRVFNALLLGPLKKYRSIEAMTIAKAMLIVADKGFVDPRIKSETIKKIVKDARN